MKTPKNKIPSIFNFLYEVSLLNSKAVNVIHSESNRTSLDVLMIGSGSLPRKKKKHLRKLIKIELSK